MLATIPLAQEVAGAEFLFDVVLVFVIVFPHLPAGSGRCPLFAPALGLDDDETQRMMSRWRLPLDRISADLHGFGSAKSRLAGVEVAELRLPRDTVVSLDHSRRAALQSRCPGADQVGDELLIVTPEDQRENTEIRLRALGRRGRLAGWRTGAEE